MTSFVHEEARSRRNVGASCSFINENIYRKSESKSDSIPFFFFFFLPHLAQIIKWPNTTGVEVSVFTWCYPGEKPSGSHLQQSGAVHKWKSCIYFFFFFPSLLDLAVCPLRKSEGKKKRCMKLHDEEIFQSDAERSLICAQLHLC